MAQLLGRDSVSLEDLSSLRNGLIARQFQGLEINTYQSIFADLSRADAARYKLVLTNISDFLKIVTTGYFRFLGEQFNSTVRYAMLNNSDSAVRQKLSFFSYHDDQQVEVGTVLGVPFETERPPFASSILHELWHDDSSEAIDCDTWRTCFDQFYVRVTYNDEPLLVPSDCKKPLPDKTACVLSEYWAYVQENGIYQGDAQARCAGPVEPQDQGFGFLN